MAMNSQQRVLTMAEAAQYLRINYCTLSRKVGMGEIPSFRIGSKILFRMDTLNSWIAAQEVQGVEPAAESTGCGVLRRVNE